MGKSWCLRKDAKHRPSELDMNETIDNCCKTNGEEEGLSARASPISGPGAALITDITGSTWSALVHSGQGHVLAAGLDGVKAPVS